jgi:DNA topoisomerase-1
VTTIEAMAGLGDVAEPPDPEQVAEDAGLRYVCDEAPGIRRRRRGKGFGYTWPDGRPVRDPPTRARIAKLAIPPAWTDVWISTDALAHLQVTGRDARGRKQYRYHDRWRQVRDAHKFDRLAEFGAALARFRVRVDDDLSLPGLPRRRVVALAVRLLDETLVRVGNREYAETNESFGLTTLRAEHLELDGDRFSLVFVGKSRQEHAVEVADRRLARVVRRCHDLGGQHLFTYRGEDGAPVPVTSADVNDYLAHHLGLAATAKWFRTWGGTALVTEVLGPLEVPGSEGAAETVVLEAIDAAADHLGNTRAVCRASYVHPGVVGAFLDGTLAEAWQRSRRTSTMRRAERATLAVLAA